MCLELLDEFSDQEVGAMYRVKNGVVDCTVLIAACGRFATGVMCVNGQKSQIERARTLRQHIESFEGEGQKTVVVEPPSIDIVWLF